MSDPHTPSIGDASRPAVLPEPNKPVTGERLGDQGDDGDQGDHIHDERGGYQVGCAESPNGRNNTHRMKLDGVPMLIVSPWSRGGWVNSQVFDHTSVIRFIEKRFAEEHPGIVETNITPWRRAVSGDLSSCFDFRTPNVARPATPDASAYMPVDKTKKPDMALAVPGNGPNGFLRAFRGASAGTGRANLEVQARFQPRALGLVLTIRNLSAQPVQVQVTDRYSGQTRHLHLRPRDADQALWTAVRHGGWYDLVISVAGDADFRVQLAGRIENGRDGISDPAYVS